MQPPTEAAFSHGPFGIALAVLMAGVTFELDILRFGHFMPPYFLPKGMNDDCFGG
jgi:hypothetical protein